MMHNPLAKRQILITRPEAQADNLAKLIIAQGGHPIMLPTLEIKSLMPAEQNALKAVLQNLAQQQLAIFISVNAVQQAFQLLQQFAIQWPFELAIAAVGNSTAKALATFGQRVTLVPSEKFSSEALLALPALQKIKGQRIIIFRGEGGRELLSSTLRKRGALLTEAVVYRRIMPTIDKDHILAAWQTKKLDIIICTSNAGLQNLVTLLGESERNWLFNMPLLVISERMRQFAEQLGFVKSPIVADNASDTAIVQALLKYYHK